MNEAWSPYTIDWLNDEELEPFIEAQQQAVRRSGQGGSARDRR